MSRPVSRAFGRRMALAFSAAVVVTAAACGRAERRPGRRPSEVLLNHSWRTTSASGGPTYAFRAGRRVELSRDGTTLSGTYDMPSDSAVVVNATGYIPGLGAGGPTTLTLRFDVRVLPERDGRERVEFRAGTGVDTLARVD